MLGAVKLFELGKLSSGRAAQLAGLSRAEFLLAKAPAGDSSGDTGIAGCRPVAE